jgi:ABC-type nitrate/sulfonate/bicarbonate transport system ATPase subunit
MSTGVVSLDERRLARVATDAPRIPWADFLANHFQWERGEHVALIGPTGQGKTTMMRQPPATSPVRHHFCDEAG